MGEYKKRVLVSSLILILISILITSFAVGIKSNKSFYTQFNNSLGEEILSCSGAGGSTCDFEMYLDLPNDYSLFGDNSINILCLPGNETWDFNKDEYTGQSSVSGVTTNTIDGTTPTDFWMVRSYQQSIWHNSDSPVTIGVNAYDIDYDGERDTIWVIGGPDSSNTYITEYNRTSLSNITQYHFTGSSLSRWPLAVHGDVIYAGVQKGTSYNTVSLINKSTGINFANMTCSCCPTSEFSGFETINKDYFWWSYPSIIIKTDSTGQCTGTNISTALSTQKGISFNWYVSGTYNDSEQLSQIWIVNPADNAVELWTKSGYPKNVSLVVGSRKISLADSGDECNTGHVITLPNSDINNYIDENGSTIPFTIHVGSQGKVKYSDINVYADNQSFPVKIVYPEPNSMQDTNLNISIYYLDNIYSSSSCSYDYGTGSRLLGTVNNHTITNFVISPGDVTLEGDLNLSFNCQNIGSSDYVSIVYDKSDPLIDYDSYTQNIIGGSYGQDTIYIGVTGSDANEKNTTFFLYDNTMTLQNSSSGFGLRSANFSVIGQSGTYWFNVTMIDEFGRSNTTALSNISVDSSAPFPITQALNVSELDMNFQTLNISGGSSDDQGLRNATTIITWWNGSQESYTHCNNSGLSCSFSFEIVPYGGSGSGGICYVQTVWLDYAGNKANSSIDSFYARPTASMDNFMKPDGTITVESQTGGTVFYINTSMKNTGNAGAYDSSVSLTLPEGWSSNETNDSFYCGNINSECNATFEITIPENATSTTYPIWSDFNYKNPDLTVSTSADNFNVYLSPNKATSLVETNIYNSSTHNVNDSFFGKFGIKSVGNSFASNIVTNTSGGNLPSNWIAFRRVPYFTYIPVGEIREVTVELTIPSGTMPGEYNTTVHLYSDDVYRDSLNLSLTISSDANWTINPISLSHQTLPTSSIGYFDSVNVTNIGNINLTFVASVQGPFSGGMTVDPVFDVTVEPLGSYLFNLNYNWPPDLSGGNYIGNVSFTETGTSLRNYSYINVTLLDTPPIFNSFSIPDYVEINKPFTASLNITDNLNDTPGVWGTFTLPNGSQQSAIINLNYAYVPPLYEITYSPTFAGQYVLNVWADDGVQPPSNMSKIFESIAKTYFSIVHSINNSYTIVDTITWSDSFILGFNTSINKTGKVNGTLVIINVTKPSQFNDAIPGEYSYPQLGEEETVPFNITIPAGTSPGLYTVNPSVFWTNPDASSSSNTTSFNVQVTSNKIISIPEDPINISIPPDFTGIVNFTINSTGNDDLSNIILSCLSGIACTDFNISSVSFSNYGFNLAAGNTEPISLTMYVPFLYDAGTYLTVINASAEDDGLYEFNVIVPDYDGWSLSPPTLNVNAGADSQGSAGNITITNLGNMLLSFDLTVSDSSALSLVESSVTVPKNSSRDVEILFTAPATVGNYTFDVTVSNGTYTLTQNSTNISISVINFSVVPISPTTVSPIIDIYNGDTLFVRGRAYYEALELTENVTWSIEINDYSCNILNATYITDSWHIYCTSPNLDDGYYYDLDLISVYQNFNAEYTYISENATHYKDITDPTFTSNVETDVVNGSDVSLTLNSDDNIAVTDRWVEIRYPNSTSVNHTIGVSGQINLDSSDLIVGDYDVTYYINDTGGNIAVRDDWFEVYIPINFSGDVLDSDNDATPINFTFYRPNTDYLLYDFITNTTDGFNISTGAIHDRNYDIGMEIMEEFPINVKLFNVTINETTQNPIDLDYIPGGLLYIALHNPLVGIGVSSNFSIEGIEVNGSNVTGNITFSYSGTEHKYDHSIKVFKCADWNYAAIGCDSIWIQQNITEDVVAKTVTVEIDSFSAYVAADSQCGNGLCEVLYFETTSTCPDDCKESAGGVTYISSGGGGGGGISRRAMEELLSKYVNDTNGTGIPGLNITKEIKAALESPTQIKGVKVATTSIYRELFPGEKLTTGIILRNVAEDQTTRITARALGTIKDFITFPEDDVTLKPLQELNFGITISSPLYSIAGGYEGSIVLESGERSIQIPVSIRIQEKTEKLLDMRIQPLVDTIPPGEDLRLQIDIYNLGKTARVDVELTYELVDALTEKIITKKQESLAVETTLSQIRTLTIPENTKLGKYLIRGTSNYLSFNKTSFASALAYVTVAEPWYLYNMFGVIPVWIIMSVLLFVGLNAGMFLGWQKYQASKKKYKIALDLKELPQPGNRTAYIGHIAETSIRTFLEVDKMQTHSIVAGSTGGGKTVAAQVLIEEALRNDVAVIVFDPTAQWTGFLRPCKERRMLKYYPKYQMKTKQAQAFNGNIHSVEDPRQILDLKKFMKPGEINIFSTNKLKLQEMDTFVASTIRQVFKANLDESPNLRVIFVYDEVHRLLPKFGGSGEGFLQIERACREFRKWGVGLVLISQVLSDFVGSIKANINTEVQVRTRDEGDLDRLKTKYGEDAMRSIIKASVGTAMIQNSAYNKGRPYFVEFRPLLHSITRLSDDDLSKYQKFNNKIDNFEYQMDQLEEFKVDVFDLRLELKLALDKLKVGKFNMVNIYLEGMAPRLKKHWDKMGKTPKERKVEVISDSDIKQAVKEAQQARKDFEKTQKPVAAPVAETPAPAEGAEAPVAETEEAKGVEEAPTEKTTKKGAKKTKAAKKGKASKAAKATKEPEPEAPEAEPEPKEKPEKPPEKIKLSPVEEFQDRYKEIQNKLSETRKKGEDTSLVEIEIKSLPADIKLFEAMQDAKSKKKLEKKMVSVEKKLK